MFCMWGDDIELCVGLHDRGALSLSSRWRLHTVTSADRDASPPDMRQCKFGIPAQHTG